MRQAAFGAWPSLAWPMRGMTNSAGTEGSFQRRPEVSTATSAKPAGRRRATHLSCFPLKVCFYSRYLHQQGREPPDGSLIQGRDSNPTEPGNYACGRLIQTWPQNIPQKGEGGAGWKGITTWLEHCEVHSRAGAEGQVTLTGSHGGTRGQLTMREDPRWAVPQGATRTPPSFQKGRVGERVKKRPGFPGDMISILNPKNWRVFMRVLPAAQRCPVFCSFPLCLEAYPSRSDEDTLSPPPQG